MSRPKHYQLPEDKKKKANSRSYLNVYINRGKLLKQPCYMCGSESVQAHHDDYSKPLDVKWLCLKHHIEFHKSIFKNAPRGT